MIDIKTFTNFSSFSTDELRRAFLAYGTIKTLQKGEIIYQCGDTAEKLYFLYQGRVDACFTDENGNYFTTGIIDAPFFIGEDAFSIPPVRVCDCIASSNAMLIGLEVKMLYELCAKNPALMQETFGLLAKKVLFLHCRIGAAIQITSAKKMAYYLLCVYHAYGKTCDSLTKENLGNYIGITRASASRILNQFQAKGLIKLNYSSITILDIDGLIDICNNDPE